MMRTDFGESKPCPFCAYDGVRFENLNAETHLEYSVMCTNCGAFGPNDLGKSGALEMWNLRRDKFPASQPAQDDVPPLVDFLMHPEQERDTGKGFSPTGNTPPKG